MLFHSVLLCEKRRKEAKELNAPLVSVIIPVYNVKPYLREALDSVLHQTYRNLEIIIIDDGATDGSEKLCDEYQRMDDRVTVIHQKNSGLSAARNTGLDVMHGKIVAFLDSDDAYCADYFEVMVKAMIAKNADIAVCGFYTCYTRNKMERFPCRRIQHRLENGCYCADEALSRMADQKLNPAVWNKIYRAELFDSLRFPVEHNYEDVLLIPFLFEKAKTVLAIDRPLMYYRKRPDSITVTPSVKNIRDFVYFIHFRSDYIAKHTPAVFSKEQKLRNIDTSLKSCIVLYAERVLLRGSDHAKRILGTEIKKESIHIHHCSLTTKVLFFFYSLNPYICCALIKCYRPVGYLIKVFHAFFPGNKMI